jgi:hypothetical protein
MVDVFGSVVKEGDIFSYDTCYIMRETYVSIDVKDISKQGIYDIDKICAKMIEGAISYSWYYYS